MTIGRIIDLSLRLDAQTQVYPGDPKPALSVATTLAGDGYNLLHVQIGSQSGTHSDAPYHFLADGARIDQMDLHRFVAPGVVIHVLGKAPAGPITVGDVAPYLDRVGPDTIVLIHTGWSEHYGTDRYYEHPFLSVGAAQALLDRGVRSFGIDTINIGETVLDGRPHDFPTNTLILSSGAVIVENLTNLGEVDFDPLISMLPIKLGDADGAPVRATAIEVLA